MHDDESGAKASELIDGARRGDGALMNQLVELIYPELKRRAFWLMTRERVGHTFGQSGSELVQRVMEKMLAAGGQVFHAARTEEDLINMLTRQMRFILVDYARAHTGRRPNPRSRVAFDSLLYATPSEKVNIEEVLNAEEALNRLADEDPDAARAFELRFFAGFNNEEGAAAMGTSVASFRRDHKRAIVFLGAMLSDGEASGK